MSCAVHPARDITHLDPATPPTSKTYKIAIRENRNRQVREVLIDNDWGEGSLEMWTEGRMSCDCARHQLLDENAEPYACPCLKRVRYSVLWAELNDGRVIAIDEPLVLH